MIRPLINHVPLNVLLDTGASDSFISKTALSRLHHGPIRNRSRTHMMADGSTPFRTCGQVELTIRMGGRNTKFIAEVAESLTTDAILGAGWIRENNVAICSQKRQIVLHDHNGQELATEPIVNNEPLVFPIVAAVKVTLRPNTERFIESLAPVASTTAIIRSSNSHNEGLDCLLLVKDYRTRISIINLSDRYVTIPAGRKIGLIECVNDDNITVNTPVQPASLNSISRADTSINPSCPSPQRPLLDQFMGKYASLFDISRATLARTSMWHAIRTGDNLPVHSRPNVQSQRQQEETAEHVQQMLKDKQIRSSNSPWSAPVVLVKKEDGSTRFVIDYRRLNEVTIKDEYPMPKIEDVINRLGGHGWFSKLDLKSGYLQIPIREEDKEKTAFKTKNGLYEFNVLPPGLKNGPPSFQRIMDGVLGNGLVAFCLVYLDDIVVFSKSAEEHARHLEEVLSVLQKHQFQLNPKKCEFFQSAIDYLGHTIDKNGARPLDHKIRAIRDMPMPSTRQQAQYFVGALGFWRRFIPRFAEIVAPIYKVINGKGQGRQNTFDWGEEQAKAFNQLKQLITSKPLVLDFPDDTSPLILSTDASDYAMGGVLKQKSPDGIKFIYYHSATFSPAQQRYSTVEREALAIYKSVEKLRPYLLGREFTIETDHCPLCNFHTRGSKNRRIDTWSILLGEYDIKEVVYKKGKCHCDADLLSRFPPMTDGNETTTTRLISAVTRSATRVTTKVAAPSSETPLPPVSTAIPSPSASSDLVQQQSSRQSPLDLSRVKEEQQKDDLIRERMSHPDKDDMVNKGMLFRAIMKERRRILLPYLPRSLIGETIRAFHDHPTAAHFGRDRTWDKLRCRCYWPGMYKDIENHVKRCFACATFNIRRQKPPGKLCPVPPPSEPFQMVGMDFWGPTQVATVNGNRYIIILTDYLTKFVVARAVPKCTAQSAAEFLVDTALQYIVPDQVLTDQGTHFRNEMFDATAKLLGCEHTLVTAYHPASNGQTERWNGTLKPKLSALFDQHLNNWDTLLSSVVHGYNTGKHATTGYAPTTLLFGHDIRLPFDSSQKPIRLSKPSSYFEFIKEQRRLLVNAARANMLENQIQTKDRFDVNRLDPVYESGQLVMVKLNGIIGKFGQQFEGPYRIRRATGQGDLTYIIGDDHQPGERKVHVSQLRLLGDGFI